jgi:hypothetical protein
MRQIIYSMHFQGRSSPLSSDEHTFKTTSSATSCTLRTTIDEAGVAGTHEAAEGDLAFVESEIHFTDHERFTERGVILFGENHSLRFSTVDNGHLEPSADPHTLAGAANWKVEGGEGQFAGATGLITSNFILSETGEINDYHFGVIFIP